MSSCEASRQPARDPLRERCGHFSANSGRERIETALVIEYIDAVALIRRDKVHRRQGTGGSRPLKSRRANQTFKTMRSVFGNLGTMQAVRVEQDDGSGALVRGHAAEKILWVLSWGKSSHVGNRTERSGRSLLLSTI